MAKGQGGKCRGDEGQGGQCVCGLRLGGLGNQPETREHQVHQALCPEDLYSFGGEGVRGKKLHID